MGALETDYFLLQLRGSFQMISRDEQMGMLVYFLTSFGIAILAGTDARRSPARGR